MIPVLFLQMLAEQKQPYESVKQANSFHNISQGKVYQKSHTGLILNIKWKKKGSGTLWSQELQHGQCLCGREMMNQLSHFGPERKGM